MNDWLLLISPLTFDLSDPRITIMYNLFVFGYFGDYVRIYLFMDYVLMRVYV